MFVKPSQRFRVCVVVDMGLSRHCSLLCVFLHFFVLVLIWVSKKLCIAALEDVGYAYKLNLEKLEKGVGITDDLPKSSMCNHGVFWLV